MSENKNVYVVQTATVWTSRENTDSADSLKSTVGVAICDGGVIGKVQDLSHILIALEV